MRFASLLAIATLAVTSVQGIPAPNPVEERGLLSSLVGDIFGGTGLSKNNHYGAPKAPWVRGSKPGWYYGPNPDKHRDLPCIKGHPKPPQHKPPPPPPPPHYPPPPPPPHYPPPPPPPHHTTSPSYPHPTTSPSYPQPTTSPSYPPPTSTYTPPPPPPPPPSDGYYPTFNNITAAVQADDYMTFGLVETIADCKDMCDSVSGCGFVNTYHDVNGKDGSPLLTCSLFEHCHGPEDADNRGGQSQPDGSINYIADSDGWCKQ